jgi:beta-1,4-mannosyltransferase
MDRLFFYPKVDFTKVDSPNPYIMNLEAELSKHFTIINENDNRGGVLEFFENLRQTDVYLFNWVENFPIYRFGKFQVLFFIFFTRIAKVMGKKMIWILHNKYSHATEKNFWTDLMYKILVHKSDLIITHSNEGIQFVAKEYEGMDVKVHFFPHPLKPKFKTKSHLPKEYDLLLWGAIHPYKGIVEFLEFLESNKIRNQAIKVLIIGKCFDEVYHRRLNASLGLNTIHINEFKTLEQISAYVEKSKFVFFPYNSSSLLSSGTLMDSLRMNAKILGPNLGAFKDLSYLSIMENYDDFKDIKKIIDAYKEVQVVDQIQLDSFFEENTWGRFGLELTKLYGKLDKNKVV